MEIAERTHGAITILDLTGELDLYNAPELEMTFMQLIKDGKIRILINFTDAPFVDSNGLAKLIFAQRELKKASGSLKLAGMSPGLRKIFAVTKLDNMLEIHDTEEGALQAFADAGA